MSEGGRSSLFTRKHKLLYMADNYAFDNQVRITQPKMLFEYCRLNKDIHWSKGDNEHEDNDIRRFVGTIHVWERF